MAPRLRPSAFLVKREVGAGRLDHVDADCIAVPREPVIVPARTFLSQLL
jgi:hypothetical protein